MSSLIVLILRPSETGPRSGLQYVARTLGTLWTCTQRVDARAEGGSERPPLHQYRVTIQTPNHKLAGGAKFGPVPKQNPTSFCMSCDITPPQCIPIHPNGIPSYLLSAQPRCSSCVDETYALDWKQTCSIHSILSPASSRCDRRARLTRFTRTLSLRPPCAPHEFPMVVLHPLLAMRDPLSVPDSALCVQSKWLEAW